MPVACSRYRTLYSIWFLSLSSEKASASIIWILLYEPISSFSRSIRELLITYLAEFSLTGIIFRLLINSCITARIYPLFPSQSSRKPDSRLMQKLPECISHILYTYPFISANTNGPHSGNSIRGNSIVVFLPGYMIK